MITGTLSRYFGWRFLSAVLAVFAGTLVLTAMIDFLELLRRSADIKDVSALLIAQITLFRVPFITERVMPFAVLVGAMFCYLNLSRRLELVVARGAGISAWQFITPALVIAALIGIVLTTVYNPISASLREHSTRLEADLSGRDSSFRSTGRGFWVRQRSEDGQSVINAKSSRQQGIELAASAFSGSTRPVASVTASRPKAQPSSRDTGGSKRRDFTPLEQRRRIATVSCCRPA